MSISAMQEYKKLLVLEKSYLINSRPDFSQPLKQHFKDKIQKVYEIEKALEKIDLYVQNLCTQ